MSNRQFDTRTETKSSLSRQPVRRREQGHVAKTSIFPKRGPLPRAISSAGNLLSASTHAAMLKCATAGRPSRAGQSLLQLQRQYGNRYVQRVLALAGKGTGEAEAAPDVEQAIQRVRGGGQALDSGARTQMESAFGADFSGVRVHTGGEADTLNRQLSARAFTTGQDIFFKQGAYNPGSSSGRELLAHELTHVVQQNGDKVQRKLTVGQPGDKYEQEADQMARAVMQQEQQPVQRDSDEGLVRRQIEEEEEEEPVQAKAESAWIQRQIVEEGEPFDTQSEGAWIQRQLSSEQPAKGWTLRGAVVSVSWSKDFDTLYKRLLVALTAKPAFAGLPKDSLWVFGQALDYFRLMACGQICAQFKESQVVRVIAKAWADPTNQRLADNALIGMARLKAGPGRVLGEGESELPASEPEKAAKALPGEKSAILGLRISFAGRQWSMSFSEAITTLRNWTEAETEAILQRRALKQDHVIVSYWSEVLGGVEIPSTVKYRRVYALLDSAEGLLDEALSRSEPEAARDWLNSAVRMVKLAAYVYDTAHREWLEYKQGAIAGAELAKRIIEIEIVILSAAAGGIGGTIARTPSLINIAATQTLLTGVETTASAFGRAYFLGEEVDVIKIISKTVSTFVTCILGGKLAEKFYGKLTATLTATELALPRLREVFASKAARHNLELLLNQVLDELKGTHASGEDVIQRLIDKVVAIPVATLTSWVD